MKKRKIIKIILITFGAGLVIAAAVGLYMFNMPHRNVQASKTDYSINATDLVKEYLADPVTANNKYLQEEGESKILLVSGIVASISKDQKDQFVVLLKESNEMAGVGCTFTAETNKNAEILKVGQKIGIKGVIRSGAGFDEDLNLYEDVIMEKCDVIN